jgi:hypothetical protein
MPRAGAPALRKAEKPRRERAARHAGEDAKWLAVHAAVVVVLAYQRAKCDGRERR